MRLLFLALMLATPAVADVQNTVTAQILPAYGHFRAATLALSDAAEADCTPQSLRVPFGLAFDAWLGVAHLRLGPGEDEGRALAVAFWPDPKGIGAKQQAALLRAADPAVLRPDTFAQQSVAMRGLFALERQLYPAEPQPSGGFSCGLTRALAADLARIAREIEVGWTNGFAASLLTAGAGDNTTYLTEAEARQALFTQLVTGLEFVKDSRIGRPLGSFDKPRPDRAEARASARSQRNIAVSLAELQGFALALAPDSPQTDAAFDRAIALAGALDDPDLAGISDPQQWLKLEIVQQQVGAVLGAVQAEVGPALGVAVGFNAADGD